MSNPSDTNTIPVWAVPIYSVLLPICVFILVYVRRRDVYDLHHSVLGLLFAVLITAVITDAIKDAVYDRWGNVVCHGNKADIKEGHKSFPSGHASWSFAGLGFLSLYLSGKVKVFDRKGHIAKLCIVLLPLLAASLVAISRVDDYWHHWNDVFAGGFLGLVVAAFCYRQFFPSPYDDDGWGPYAYFDALLEESVKDDGDAAAQTTNALTAQPMEVRANGDLDYGSTSRFDDIEQGKRVKNYALGVGAPPTIQRVSSLGTSIEKKEAAQHSFLSHHF
ncbi:hypothetical protein V6N11_004444 [Hibiscus sabdariffa]|uniref:Phosphatidic acid phosphatase type 2/haloperoxidase domain-containing protein n=1 Tax=Hibiscus sabdariffa TaxID=183260 RepID=A0ABR2SGU3_9ROSI